MKSQPKVTIVTVVYNLIKADRRNYFIECLESVHKQTYSNIEHLVIDGASNDGTLEILKEYANMGWIKYISEPDTGIYNAMNKGILKAQGKYIVFLNSDDFFHNNKFVGANVKVLEKNQADFSYSKHINVNERGQFLSIRTTNIGTFYLRMPFSHQSMFVKKDTLRDFGGFNESYKLAADYEMIIKCFLKQKKGVFCPLVGVSFRNNGATNVSREQSLKETIQIMQSLFEPTISKNDYRDFLFNLRCSRDLFYKIYQMVSKDVQVEMLKSVSEKSLQKKIVKIVKYPHLTSKNKLNRFIKTREDARYITYYFCGIKIWVHDKRTKNQRQNILVIAREFFDKNQTCNGSQAYLLSSLKGLSEYYNVDFCSLSVPYAEQHIFDRNFIYPDFCLGYTKKSQNNFIKTKNDTKNLINYYSLYLKLKYPKHRRKEIKRILRYKLLGINKKKIFSSPLRKDELQFISDILRHNKYDAIIVSYVYLANVFDLPKVKNIKHKIILTHDVIHQRRALFLQQNIPLKAIAYWDKEQELSYLDKANILLAIQDAERKILQDIFPEKTVLTFPIIQNIQGKHFLPEREIAFFASNNDVNRESLKIFLQKVFPSVLKKLPNIVLKVYGGINLEEFASSQVIFAGKIADIKDGYAQARISIAPLVAGSGLKIKVVESFANATPVVGTSIAFQGLEEVNGICGFMADGEEAAERITLLMTDNELCQKMSDNCLKLISDKFSAAAIIEPLNHILNQ